MERYLDYFREEHLDVLMQKKLFSGMTHDEIKSFIFFAKPLYVKLYEGQSLQLEYEYFNMMGLVISGAMHVFSVSYDGNRTLMRSMKNGEAGGVLCSLIDYRRYLIELVAYQDAEMIMFSADAVFQTEGTIVVPQHKILVNIIQSQREMYLDMAEHLAILSQRTVRTKILRFLRYYSEMNNSLDFRVPYTREGLADYLAVDRASLSRSLGAMRDEGVIEFDRGSFKVLEEDKLYDN